MTHTARMFASVSLITVATALCMPGAAYADQLLFGAVTSAAGDKMGGVTVSAKADGSTITTSVHTDASGNYYFPPLPDGKYRVWAQAVTFQADKGNIELSKTVRQNFVLKPITNKEDWVRQLPGEAFLAALPDATPEDARMKVQVRKNCTGCHSASYPLQFRFDKEGWSKSLDLMKQVNVSGVYPRPAEPKITQNIDFHQKELADYLARARGPGESSLKFNLRPRPTGEAARVVYQEYDFQWKAAHHSLDGSDWSLGTPSAMFHRKGVHDAQLDFDGNMWIVYSHAGWDTTIARVDAKTGKIKHFKLDDVRGIALGSHGITRDEDGVMWFNTRSNVQRGHGGLAKLDPKTEKITVYLPPRPMSGTAGTLDADLNGNIWVTSPDGALRFNIKDEKFTEFKSRTYKSPQVGTATVYGLAADRNGNGWWLLMQQDLVDYSDIKTGQTGELKLPPDEAAMETLTPEQRKMYDTFIPPDFNTPFAWAQAPRRMGADKKSDYVWVGNSFGGNLAKININTAEVTLVPLPNPDAHQPYQVAVDNSHNVWTNLWSTDALAKFDPSTSQWTLFDLPTRGSETRHIALLEKDGKTKVVVPYYRTRKVAIMTLRSEAEIAALKAQAER